MRMQQISVTLSANAGVAIHIGGRRIWVDVLHHEKQSGFSTLDADLQQRMLQCEAFFHPDYICATHCHPDHYSPILTKTAKRIWPKAKLLLPEPEFAEQILVSGENFRLEDGAVTLEFFTLPHEGAQYADVKHYGILIQGGGKSILLAGDCATASPALAQALQGRTVDLAILDFPWVTLGKGREFVQKFLQPKHLLVCHLPFEEDDICGYRQAAKKSVDALSQQMDIRLLWNPLQTELI
jgi:L-ascorbate metabolism protein UlaG (beta-lactamase superfamily)